MIRRILIYIALALLAVGVFYFQHRANVQLRTENAVLASQVNALSDLRAQDAKTAQGYANEVARVNKANAEWARRLMDESQNENVRDFLALPIPDSLRDAINEYLQSKAPAH